MSEKREVPSAIKKILAFDMKITETFINIAEKIPFLKALRIHSKLLEISCHGIPWFAFWMAFTWLFNDASLIELQVNMLIGLLLDIILIAVSKAYFRRRRPKQNKKDAFVQVGPDEFSFPSGHCSRATFVAYFFLACYTVPIICVPPILAWTTAVCLSRIVSNRHYVLDVIGGVALGLIEGLLMSMIWLSAEHAKYLMSFVSDDYSYGGDYHV